MDPTQGSVSVPRPPNFWFSRRMCLALTACFGFAFNYAMRVNLSVGIVCMVNHTALSEHDEGYNNGNHHENRDPECSSLINTSYPTIPSRDGPFDWLKEKQGLLLSSFFYGYLLLQIPGGLLAHYFGGIRVLAVTFLFASCATICFPFAAKFSFYAALVLRLCVGLGLSSNYPSMYKVWATWAPPLERSILIAVGFSGAQLGTAVGLPLSGYLCSWFGWESVFYTTGGVAVLWVVVWMCITAEEPGQHPCISKIELEYIESCIAAEIQFDDQSQQKKIGIMDLPWRQIMTSKPVYALFVSHVAVNFGAYLVLTSLPTFMSEVLQFSLQSDALLSALPYVAIFLTTVIAGYIADTLRKSGQLSTTNVRKLMVTISLLGQAAGFMGAAYCGCDQRFLAVGFMVVAMGLSGCQTAGHCANASDISGKFSSVVFGISNTFGTISGIVAPEVVAYFTKNGTRQEWQTVFWITSAIMLFGTVFFCIFGSGEVQPWATDLGQPFASDAKKDPCSEMNDDEVQQEWRMRTI